MPTTTKPRRPAILHAAAKALVARTKSRTEKNLEKAGAALVAAYKDGWTFHEIDAAEKAAA